MIPYNTDAPLYHPPIATAALIVLNCSLFFAVPTSMLELSNFDQTELPWGPENAAEAPDEEVFHDAGERWDAGDFRIMDEQPAADKSADKTADGAAAEAADEGPRDTPAVPARQSRWRLDNLKLALQHGQGLKPWQWLSSIFMHADFFHLLFNMIALWAFGLVVEGKVGGLVFTSIFLAIGIAQSGLEQSLMLFADGGGSLGASAAIFGILGIAVVWAPKNDFDVFWSFGFRAGSIEIPILIYGVLVLAIESLSIGLNRFGMSSGVLHLMGLVLGLAVGYVWVRRQWVDCEGWDLINVWQGNEARHQPDRELDDQARQLVRESNRRRYPAAATAEHGHTSGPSPAPPASGRRTKPPAAPSPTHAQALQDVEQLIAEGNIHTALKLLAKLKVSAPTLQLSQTGLHGLIKSLLGAKHFTAAIPFMREYNLRFAQHAVPMQLNLAKLLLHLQQPRKAGEVLRGLRPEKLDPSAQAAWHELAAHIRHQIDEGVVEVSEEG